MYNPEVVGVKLVANVPDESLVTVPKLTELPLASTAVSCTVTP